MRIFPPKLNDMSNTIYHNNLQQFLPSRHTKCTFLTVLFVKCPYFNWNKTHCSKHKEKHRPSSSVTLSSEL